LIFGRGLGELLDRQFEAGVDAVQIFDTVGWVLPAAEFQKWCIEPSARIVATVRKQISKAKIIGFPRGAGTRLVPYIAGVPVRCGRLDWMIEPGFAASKSRSGGRFKVISIRWCCSPAATRSIARSVRFWTHSRRSFYFQSRTWRSAGDAA